MLTPEQIKQLEEERATMSYDDLLSKYEDLAPHEEAEEDEVEEGSEDEQANALKEKLLRTPGAPSNAKIEEWKALWGQEGVSMAALADSDIFVFRYITDSEWSELQMVARALTQRAQGKAELLTQMEEDIKLKVLQACVLWPQVDKEFFSKRRGGLKEQLHYFIMLNSYFFSPQQAVAYTTVL